MNKLNILLLFTVALISGGYGYLKNLSEKPVNIIYTAKIDAKLNIGKKAEDRALPNFLSVTSKGQISLASLKNSETQGFIQYSEFSAPDVAATQNNQSFLLKKDSDNNYLYSSSNNAVEASYSDWVLQNNTKWLLKNLLAYNNPKAQCRFLLGELTYRCTLETESNVANVNQSSQFTVDIFKKNLFSKEFQIVVKSNKDAAASTAAFTTESSEAHFVLNFIDEAPPVTASEQHWSELINSKMSAKVQSEVEQNQAKLIDMAELKQILNKHFNENINNGTFRKNISLALKVRFNEIRSDIDLLLKAADKDKQREISSLFLSQGTENLDRYILNKFFERFQKNELLTKHFLTTIALSKDNSSARTEFFFKLQDKYKLSEKASNLTTVYWLTVSNYARLLDNKTIAKQLLLPLSQLMSSEQKQSQAMGLFLLTCAGNAGDVLEIKTVENFAARNKLQTSCDYLESVRFQSSAEVSKSFQTFLSQGTLSKCVKPALELLTSDSSQLSEDLIETLKTTMANNQAQIPFDSELVDYIDNL